jgi:hypothetical protein
MAHSQRNQAATLSLIDGAEARWPGVAAAAIAWWSDASESLPSPSRLEDRCGRHLDDVKSPAWPDVTTVAGAWWTDGAEVAVRTQQAPVAVHEEPEAHWPELAATATSWWTEDLASGVYLTQTFERAALATA